MSSPIVRARLTVAGLLSASLALLSIQPSRAALLYSNNFDTAPVLAPGAVVTTPLSNGIIQSAINNLAWPSWKDNYFANQTFQSSVLELGNLPAHSQIDIDFTLGFLGSWDSTEATYHPTPIT